VSAPPPTLPMVQVEGPHVPAPHDRVPHDHQWDRLAGRVRLLSWFSLALMAAEAVGGGLAGIQSDSVALVGWALGSAIEGAASVAVIWRFTGSRRHSASAELTATRAVAASLFLLAAYLAVQSLRALIGGSHPGVSVLGMAVTGASAILMPGLGLLKLRLGERLGSTSTSGEGTQNLLCAAQATAVLVGLAANALLGAWWLDDVVALGLAAVAVHEGREAWHGEVCTCGVGVQESSSSCSASPSCSDDCGD